MALQTSGQITLSQVQSEFGGSNPIHLTEYYRNNGLVPSTISTTTGNPAGSYTGPRYNTSNLWEVYSSQIIKWNGVTIYNGTVTATTFQVGIYEYTRGDNKYHLDGPKSNPIPLDKYEISRRVASTQTTTTTTVNSSIPVSPNQISLKNMYGGRKT